MSAPHPPPCNSCQRWLADGGGGCCRICSAAIQLTRLIGNQAFTAADFGDLSSRLTTLVGEYVVKVGTPDLTRAVAYSISPRQSGGLLIQPGIRAGEGGEAASHRRSGFESPTAKAPPAPPGSGAASTGTDRTTSRPRGSGAGRSPRRDRKRSRSSGVKGNVKPECPNQLFLLGLNGQLLVGDPRWQQQGVQVHSLGFKSSWSSTCC